MTKNKRFKLHIKWYNIEKTEGEATLTDNGQPLIETEQITDARLLKNILNDLYNENEQLKAQLYCDDKEGVCNICKHHYLVKDDELGLGYYNSRCKKGHYECAKFFLKHCEDFELKGDLE